MFRKHKRITVFTGNLGSGKTEISVNYALGLSKENLNTALVDLDIVNPYFRTRLVKDVLAVRGLRVVCPAGELASADLPALSPAIRGVFENQDINGVFDVGGDDIGATALGRFKQFFNPGHYELLMVVNPCRPFTRDTEGIIKILRSIERAARLNIDGLVSNTNLGRETDAETVLEGHRIVLEAARQINIPVAFIAVDNKLVAEVSGKLDPELPILNMELFMNTPWAIKEQVRS